jgi:hypothetical protein
MSAIPKLTKGIIFHLDEKARSKKFRSDRFEACRSEYKPVIVWIGLPPAFGFVRLSPEC